MRGDEVDAGSRVPGVGLVQVGATCQPGREHTERGRFAAPEVTHGIAVPPVPFRPQRRGGGDLIAAPPGIPPLSDEVYLGYGRVLLYQMGRSPQPGPLAGICRPAC